LSGRIDLRRIGEAESKSVRELADTGIPSSTIAKIRPAMWHSGNLDRRISRGENARDRPDPLLALDGGRERADNFEIFF
jgi:hypothetical protein